MENLGVKRFPAWSTATGEKPLSTESLERPAEPAKSSRKSHRPDQAGGWTEVFGPEGETRGTASRQKSRDGAKKTPASGGAGGKGKDGGAAGLSTEPAATSTTDGGAAGLPTEPAAPSTTGAPAHGKRVSI